MSAFNSNVIENINYIVCPPDIDKNLITSFETDSRRWIELSSHVHVFDFRNVKRIHPSFFSSMAKFRQDLLKRDARVVSVNMSSVILDQVTRAGMDKALGYVKDFAAKSQKASTAKSNSPEFRKLFVKQLVEAAYQAMNIMFNSTLAADENYTQNPRDFSIAEFDCASILNVESAALKIQLRLYFPGNTLKSLSQGLTGFDPTRIDRETMDSTATELLNIMYGRAKSKLNDEKNYNLPPAIPSIRQKAQLSEIKRTDPKNIVFLPLASPFGTFSLEVDFG